VKTAQRHGYKGRHRIRTKLRYTKFAFHVLVTALIGLAFTGVILTRSTEARATDYATPINAMFYYPWFPETWYSNDHYVPALGNYSSDNATIAATHISEMKYAGMQVAIASWWGIGQHNEQTRFPILYKAATTQSFGIVPYYEPEGQGDPSVSTIQTDLAHLKSFADSYPGGSVHIGGKPVIFVYNADAGGCADVTKWKTATNGFTTWYVNMKVFDGYKNCPDQPSSWHQYGPARAEDPQLPYSFTISPGYWHHDETTPRLPRDITRWTSNVTDLANTSAQWRLVTTFNEEGESTAVEPSPSWQSDSGFGSYLDILHNKLVASPSPSPSPSSTGTPTPSSSPTVSPSPTTTSPSPSPTITSPSPTPTPSPSPSPTLPHPDHVIVVIFENHSYSQIVGNSSAPWLNSIIPSSALLTNSYAIRHPSEPNYLAIFSGSTQGVTDDSCNYSFSGPNLARQALDASVSFGAYSEDLPAVGSTVCTSGGYAKKHAPWAFFTNVPGSVEMPYSMFPTDYSTLPNISFIIPNLCDDMHDCSISTGDTWARNHLSSYLSWATTHNSELIVTFDEDNGSEGNRILTIVSGANVRSGSYGEFVNHYRILRTIEGLFSLPPINAAILTTPITDIWI
jgi:phosphatidylinositol-3-phosphatase